MKSISKRYIIYEFLPPFFGGLCIFGFILIMDKVLRLIDLILIKGIDPIVIGSIFLHILPPLFSFTIPVSILFGTLLCLGRLSSDNEIIAFKSCGFHPVQIIAPIILFGIFATLVCLILETSIIPNSNSQFRTKLLSLQKEKTFLSIKDKGFQDLGNGMVAYVKASNKENGYEGILICDEHDQGNSRVIFAQKGRIALNDHGERLSISLTAGSIHPLYLNGALIYDMINFGRYDISIPLPSSINRTQKRHKEFSSRKIAYELRSGLLDFEKETGLRLEFHRRFAFPFACLIFAFIGAMIGMESRWSGKGTSFALSIIIILLYYFLMAIGSHLTYAGLLLPWIASWLPNIVFLLLGIFLLREAL